MFGRGTKDPVRVDTLIHESVQIQGDLEFSGGLHIDGRVVGNVRAGRQARSMMSMSNKGRIDGSVEASNVVLNGIVMGDIRASERVVLGSGARIRGNVYYGIIEMALGAEIKGKLVRIEAAKPAPALTAPATDPTL
jgi:cytoskeletal protein CcmA (bactofilin family)